MKTCYKCKEIKEEIAFYPSRLRKNDYCCKECSKENGRKDSNYEYSKISAFRKDNENICMICKSHPRKEKMLAIDHDHNTGKIRGLLCTKCNLGIGCFKDDVKLLQKAITYLKKK